MRQAADCHRQGAQQQQVVPLGLTTRTCVRQLSNCCKQTAGLTLELLQLLQLLLRLLALLNPAYDQQQQASGFACGCVWAGCRCKAQLPCPCLLLQQQLTLLLESVVQQLWTAGWARPLAPAVAAVAGLLPLYVLLPAYPQQHSPAWGRTETASPHS